MNEAMLRREAEEREQNRRAWAAARQAKPAEEPREPLAVLRGTRRALQALADEGHSVQVATGCSTRRDDSGAASTPTGLRAVRKSEERKAESGQRWLNDDTVLLDGRWECALGEPDVVQVLDHKTADKDGVPKGEWVRVERQGFGAAKVWRERYEEGDEPERHVYLVRRELGRITCSCPSSRMCAHRVAYRAWLAIGAHRRDLRAQEMGRTAAQYRQAAYGTYRRAVPAGGVRSP